MVASLRVRLAVLAGAALVARAYVALLSATIAADSAFYLETARALRHGSVDQALSLYGLHPLFPMLASLAPGVEGAAWTIAVLAGALAVIPLHAIARLYASPRIADAAGLLYAFHPILVQETADPLPTSLAILFVLSALACGLYALRGGRWILYPLAGLFCGLAYLARTEGILAAAFLLGASPFFRPWKRILLGTAVAAVAGAAVAGPYVAYVSRKAGRFAITQKGGGTVLLHALQGEAVEPPSEQRHAFFGNVTKRLLRAIYPAILPLLALGFWAERKNFRRMLPLFLFAIGALLPPILMFLLNRYFRTSHRYFLLGTTLLLPWAGAGYVALLDLLRRRPAVLAAHLVLAAILLGKNVLPRRTDEIPFKEAGRWLATRGPIDLVASSDKISWYARTRFIPMTAPKKALDRFGNGGRFFLAIDEKTLEDAPHWEEELRDLTLVRVFEGGRTVRIYR